MMQTHSSTVATNALIERRGARIGLVTSHGFRDLFEHFHDEIPIGSIKIGMQALAPGKVLQTFQCADFGLIGTAMRDDRFRDREPAPGWSQVDGLTAIGYLQRANDFFRNRDKKLLGELNQVLKCRIRLIKLKHRKFRIVAH